MYPEEHALVVSEERAAGREHERRDVLSFIEAEFRKFAREASDSSARTGTSDRTLRLEAKASVLSTIHGYLQRGDHVGVADLFQSTSPGRD
jgi:hypothetical protein